jgi:N-methylhydantoinase B
MMPGGVLKTVDPTTFEIISHRLHQITVQMGTTLERVGGTATTTQMHDYMTALFRPDGQILCSGRSMAFYVPCASLAVKEIIKRFENDGGVEPDDMFLLNDPYIAAMHQPDIYMIAPIHYKDRLVAWSATFVHVMDTGGMSPGGTCPGATEIFHEGIRTPGLKLVERGKLRQDVFQTLINMTRQPVMVGLDLKCEIAANNVAKARMWEMLGQYGPELIDAVSTELIDYTETVLRGRLMEIPDGEWSEEGEIQADRKWRVAVKLRKEGDRLRFDFTGSDPQATLGINLPYHAACGSCYDVVVSTIGYDLPKNHGAVRFIEVVAPEGSVVSATYPAPVSLNTTSGVVSVRYLVNSVVMRMIAAHRRWQDEVIAVMAGHRAFLHAGVNQYQRYYAASFLELDGNGATAKHDGINSSGSLLSSLLSCHNVEWAEVNFPLLYLFRRHILDGAGAGKCRGGAGAETAAMVYDAPEGKIRGAAFGVAGHRNSGRGIFGGYPAAPSVLLLFENTPIGALFARDDWPGEPVEWGAQRKELGYCDIEAKTGDIVYIRRASGGGYGDPLERPATLVCRDVVNRLVSAQAAREVYGVVIDPATMTPDSSATTELRSRLRRSRLKRGE